MKCDRDAQGGKMGTAQNGVKCCANETRFEAPLSPMSHTITENPFVINHSKVAGMRTRESALVVTVMTVMTHRKRNWAKEHCFLKHTKLQSNEEPSATHQRPFDQNGMSAWTVTLVISKLLCWFKCQANIATLPCEINH